MVKKETVKAVVYAKDGQLTLRLENRYGFSEKEFDSIDQLLGQLREWWVIGLDWEPKQVKGKKW